MFQMTKINIYVQKSTKNASLYINSLLKGNEGERLIYHWQNSIFEIIKKNIETY